MEHPETDMRKWLAEIACPIERARFVWEFGIDPEYFDAECSTDDCNS